jgi:hypothetical protein
VTRLGDYAFDHCGGLTNLAFLLGVTNISGYRPFFYCSKLTTLTLPDGLLSIGSGAFENCSSLTNFTLPETRSRPQNSCDQSSHARNHKTPNEHFVYNSDHLPA